jgi:hypothetical protein
MPEVHFHAVMLALADMHFPGEDDAYVTWVCDLARRLYAKPFHRVLMFFTSPSRVLASMPALWSRFHRRTSCTCDALSGKMALCSLHYPPHLVNRIQARTFGSATIAALEAAGAKEISVSITEHGPERSVHSVTWR